MLRLPSCGEIRLHQVSQPGINVVGQHEHPARHVQHARNHGNKQLYARQSRSRLGGFRNVVTRGQHPAGNYVVKLPVRDSNGQLKFKLGMIAMADDVRVGYLPLTRRNIIKQAFKFLGQRYGWGGMFNTRDCSAFIMDNFRSMGVLLPRNAGEQGKMSVGITHSFADEMTLDQRKEIFAGLPATPIYMNGHAMLYLGCCEEDYFIIHDFAGFRVPDENGEMKLSKTRCVFVTPLLQTFLSSGKRYIEGLYAAREFNF